MVEKRKSLRCDCNEILREKEIKLDGILTKAMVCPKCKFITLTLEQAKEYHKKLKLHQDVDQERQIIKIGNSMGITLPDKLNEYGIKIGKKVKIEAIDENSLKIKIIK
jgi:antitoxin component of MazEF toxin-antitoxin module